MGRDRGARHAGHDRVAVQEQLLDVEVLVHLCQRVGVRVGQAGDLDLPFLAGADAGAPEALQEVGGGLARFGPAIPAPFQVDVVRLHVEDELVLGPALVEHLGVVDHRFAHVPGPAEYLVHGEQATENPCRALHERPAVDAQPARVAPRVLEHDLLGAALLDGLAERHEFFIGDDLGGNGRVQLAGLVLVALSDPHGHLPANENTDSLCFSIHRRSIPAGRNQRRVKEDSRTIGGFGPMSQPRVTACHSSLS